MFVQVMDFHTSRMEEGRKLVDEYEAATEGKRTARRAVMCRDREDPNHYINVVFFDSYESAMKNSELPETTHLAEQLGKLLEGEMKFLNLDVVEDRTM
jgi:quinol monooxygenase YgiN